MATTEHEQPGEEELNSINTAVRGEGGTTDTRRSTQRQRRRVSFTKTVVASIHEFKREDDSEDEFSQCLKILDELNNPNCNSKPSTEEMPRTSESSDHVEQEAHQLINPRKDCIDVEVDTDEFKSKVCDSGSCDEKDTSHGSRQHSHIPCGSDQQLLSPLAASKSPITEQRHVSSATNEIPDSDAEQKCRPNGKDWHAENETSLKVESLYYANTINSLSGLRKRWHADNEGLQSSSRKHSGIKTSIGCKRQRDKLVLMNEDQTEGTSSSGSGPGNSMTLLKQPNESDDEGICRRKKVKKGGTKRVYWDADMDRELAKALREERNLGNESDGKLNTSSYNSAAGTLSIHFAKNITASNIRNRLASWYKIFTILSNILSQSCFSWDSSKQMIAVDDELQWENYVKNHEEAKQFRKRVFPNWDDIMDFCMKELATDVTETPLDAYDRVMLNDTDSIDVDKASHSKDSNDMRSEGEKASHRDCSNLSPTVDPLLADNNANFLTLIPSYPTKESEFHSVGVNSNSATNLKDYVEEEPADDGTRNRAAEAESFPNKELCKANGYSTFSAKEMAHILDDGLPERASFQNQSQSSDHVNQEDHQLNPSKNSNDEIETEGFRVDSPIPYSFDQELLSTLTASKSLVSEQRHVSTATNEIPDSDAEPNRPIKSQEKKGPWSPSREHSASKTPSGYNGWRDPQLRQSGVDNSTTLLKKPNQSEGEGISRMKKVKKGGRRVGKYCYWNADMDRELAKRLREERYLGNQSDGKLSTSAYTSAASSLSIYFAKKITTKNVRNRLVSWNTMYANLSSILSQSGFSWDSSKQMISVDDELEWENYVKNHEGAKLFRERVFPNWDEIRDFCMKELAADATETPLDAYDGVMLNDNDSIDVDKTNHSKDSNDTGFVGENASPCSYSNLSSIEDALLANNNTDFLTSTLSYPTKETELHQGGVNSNSAKDSVDVEPVDDCTHDRAPEAESFPDTELSNAIGYSTISTEEMVHTLDDGLADHVPIQNQSQSFEHVNQGSHDRAAEAESFPNTELSNAIGYSTMSTEEMVHTLDDGLTDHAPFQNQSRSSEHINQEVHQFNPSEDSIYDESERDGPETKICHGGGCDEEVTLQGLTQDSPIIYGPDQQLLSPLTSSKCSVATSSHVTSPRNEIPYSEAEQIYRLDHQFALAEMGISQIRSGINKNGDLLNVTLEEQLYEKDQNNAEYVTRTNIENSGIETPMSPKKHIQTPETSKKSDLGVISSSQLIVSGTNVPPNLSVTQNITRPVLSYSRRATSFTGTTLQNGKGLPKEVEALKFQTPLTEMETSNTQLRGADEGIQTERGSDVLMITASPASPLRRTVQSLHEKGLRNPSTEHSGDVLRTDNVHHGENSNGRKRRHDELVLTNEDPTEESPNSQHRPRLILATLDTEIPIDACNGDMLNNTEIGSSQSDDSTTRITRRHKLGKSLPSLNTGCSTLKIMGRLDKMEKAITTMASSITDMSSSMAVYFNPKPEKVDIDDLYDTVRRIPELSENTFFRVCNWLMEDETKFRFLKKLPEDQRKRYVLLYMR